MKKINLDHKKFGLLSNSENGEVSQETIFRYEQQEEVVIATYEGGSVIWGTILGRWQDEEQIDMLYQCLTTEGHLKAGKAKAIASIMENGKIQLSLDWQWLNGDRSAGKSTYMEID